MCSSQVETVLTITVTLTSVLNVAACVIPHVQVPAWQGQSTGCLAEREVQDTVRRITVSSANVAAAAHCHWSASGVQQPPDFLQRPASPRCPPPNCSTGCSQQMLHPSPTMDHTVTTCSSSSSITLQQTQITLDAVSVAALFSLATPLVVHSLAQKLTSLGQMRHTQFWIQLHWPQDMTVVHIIVNLTSVCRSQQICMHLLAVR